LTSAVFTRALVTCTIPTCGAGLSKGGFMVDVAGTAID